MNSSPYPFPYGRGGGLERRLVHELRAVVVLPHRSDSDHPAQLVNSTPSVQPARVRRHEEAPLRWRVRLPTRVMAESPVPCQSRAAREPRLEE